MAPSVVAHKLAQVVVTLDVIARLLLFGDQALLLQGFGHGAHEFDSIHDGV